MGRNVWEGRVLNRFANPTKLALDELRNDLNPELPADQHLDALALYHSYSGINSIILLDLPDPLTRSNKTLQGERLQPVKAIEGVDRLAV